MSPVSESSALQMTRRALLAHAARGTMFVSASPYLHGMETLLASGEASVRSKDSFDFGWKFLQSDVTGAQLPQFNDASWRELDLPHDWSIEGSFDEKAASAGPGAYLPSGIGWYRKHFRLPESAKGKVITLEFDGVYQNSEVWINGVSLGLRPYGYVPFYYDLTPHLSASGENVVAVRVDNSRQTNCRWYSGSGIYRHTWLYATDPVHVAHWGTCVTTPKITKNAATVEIKTRVLNRTKTSAQCTLTTAVLDAKGETAQSGEASSTITASGEYEFVQQLVVDHPTLWSPKNPVLYTVRSTVRESGRVVDVYDTPVGIREAIFDADRGFLLNGELIKLKGVCLHHEAGSVGAAVPLRVWERRLEILQELGCNAIRASHNPYAAEFLDLCDRMGFLVMAEAFDEWKFMKGQITKGYSLYFDEWHERDLKNFIHRDRNHPSIVLWSAGNEIGDQSSPDGPETLRKLLHIFHTEDPTRLVTAGCDRIASDPPSNTALPEFLALLDVVGYNYMDRWHDRANKYLSIDRHDYPNRRFIGTESSGMGAVRGDYSGLFPGEGSPVRHSVLYEGNVDINIEEQWKFVSTYDYVSGDFMWTGIDYLGEAKWPLKGSNAGIIDTCGFKKDGFYFYQSQWTEKPMIHLWPHWNWSGYEGQVIPVTCYTNCDTVELFLNGKSMGVKGYEFPKLGMEGFYSNFPARARILRTTGDLHLSWDVPYESGTLKAVGTKGGSIVLTEEMQTTGPAATISISVDRPRILADRRDVVHITVAVTDEHGRMIPTAENEVIFEVSGEGKLIGVDNGDQQSHEQYKVSHRKTFHGLCLAIVQSTGKAGRITIAASSPSLRAGTVTVETTAS